MLIVIDGFLFSVVFSLNDIEADAQGPVLHVGNSPLCCSAAACVAALWWSVCAVPLLMKLALFSAIFVDSLGASVLRLMCFSL